MPDVRDQWLDWSHYDGRTFTTRLSLVPILDYNYFSQDDQSFAQVKTQKNQWDLRTFRIMLSGTFKWRVPLTYFASFEIKGKDHVTRSDDSKLGWTDLNFATAIPKLGRIFFGKVKEPWVYEMVGDAANLQQEERVLNPFFVSRNIGVRVQNTFAHSRMSWAGGWFNDWWVVGDSYASSGNTFSGRFTGLPYWEGDAAHYVHLGISARYNGADNDEMQFRGRPESNVSSYYVDSGVFPATHANEYGVEGIWGNGPFLVTTEYVHAAVHSPQTGTPAFQGGYVTVSYVLTGEHRPYDRSVAYARRVMPASRWGAWEIFTR
jgi:phosphate-selective porin